MLVVHDGFRLREELEGIRREELEGIRVIEGRVRGDQGKWGKG